MAVYNAIKMNYGDEYSVTPEVLINILTSINFNEFTIEIINRIYREELYYLIRVGRP